VGTIADWQFSTLSHRISETAQDRTKGAIDHKWEVAYTLSIDSKIDFDLELTLNGQAIMRCYIAHVFGVHHKN